MGACDLRGAGAYVGPGYAGSLRGAGACWGPGLERAGDQGLLGAWVGTYEGPRPAGGLGPAGGWHLSGARVYWGPMGGQGLCGAGPCWGPMRGRGVLEVRAYGAPGSAEGRGQDVLGIGACWGSGLGTMRG